MGPNVFAPYGAILKALEAFPPMPWPMASARPAVAPWFETDSNLKGQTNHAKDNTGIF